MKNQSGTIKTNLELDRVVMRVQVVTGDSQEEVMIFRDRQTDKQTLHHNIYIIIIVTISIICTSSVHCIPANTIDTSNGDHHL